MSPLDYGAYRRRRVMMIPEYGGNLFNLDGMESLARINVVNVRDEHSMRYLVAGQDYLFNLAGQTSRVDSMRDPFTDLDINCRSQLSILEVCRRTNPAIRGVFASTRQIYGVPDYLPVDERHLLHDPRLLADALCRLLKEPEAAQAMGRASRSRIEERYRFTHVKERFLRAVNWIQ